MQQVICAHCGSSFLPTTVQKVKYCSIDCFLLSKHIPKKEKTPQKTTENLQVSPDNVLYGILLSDGLYYKGPTLTTNLVTGEEKPPCHNPKAAKNRVPKAQAKRYATREAAELATQHFARSFTSWSIVELTNKLT